MALKRPSAVTLLKRTVAAIFLVLVVSAFFGGRRLAHIAVSLQATPAVLRNPWVFAPVFLVGTALVGRFFCETMCPLGILQSLVNWLCHPKSSVRRVCTRLPETTAQRIVRWTVLVVVVALLGFGWGALAWSVEPYSILGRALTLVGGFQFVLAAILLAAAVGTGRIWCNWVCPVGTVFALVGRFAPWGNKVESRCANCRKCFPKKQEATPEEPVRQSTKHNAQSTTHTDGVTRRTTLKGIALLAAAEKLTDGGLADLVLPGSATRGRPVLPPGALSRGRFTRACLACGLCIKACPAGVLAPSMKARTFGQPELDFTKGFCHPDCDQQCAKACPAGAIRRLADVARRDVHIGLATWRADRCLRTTEGVSCHICLRKCPVKAIHWVEGEDGKGGAMVVDENACIGCGVCERQCAARPLPALVVEGLDIQRIVRPMGKADLVAEMGSLLDGEASVVVAKDGVICASETGRGIAPFLRLHDAGRLAKAEVAGRVIGRAAAAICLSGGVARVHARLLADDAAKLLRDAGVAVTGDETVPSILNRAKTDSCPMCKAVEGLTDPAEMVAALRKAAAPIA